MAKSKADRQRDAARKARKNPIKKKESPIRINLTEYGGNMSSFIDSISNAALHASLGTRDESFGYNVHAPVFPKSLKGHSITTKNKVIVSMPPLTPLSERVIALCESIGEAEPIFLPFTWIDDLYEGGKCHYNVMNCVKRYGGRRITGWMIFENWAEANAEFHSVWEDPEGNLIDISPRAFGEETILFMPDPNTNFFISNEYPDKFKYPIQRSTYPGQPFVDGEPNPITNAYIPRAMPGPYVLKEIPIDNALFEKYGIHVNELMEEDPLTDDKYPMVLYV